MNKRYGRFFISRRLLEDFPDRVVSMFFRLEIIVVRAEMLYDKDGIEYVGISPHFEETSPEYIVPLYEIIGIISSNENENYEIRKSRYA